MLWAIMPRAQRLEERDPTAIDTPSSRSSTLVQTVVQRLSRLSEAFPHSCPAQRKPYVKKKKS